MRQITLEPNNFATPTTTGLASYLTLAFALAVEGWGELEDEEEEVMDTISNEGEEEEEDRRRRRSKRESTCPDIMPATQRASFCGAKCSDQYQYRVDGVDVAQETERN